MYKYLVPAFFLASTMHCCSFNGLVSGLASTVVDYAISSLTTVSSASLYPGELLQVSIKPAANNYLVKSSSSLVLKIKL